MRRNGSHLQQKIEAFLAASGARIKPTCRGPRSYLLTYRIIGSGCTATKAGRDKSNQENGATLLAWQNSLLCMRPLYLLLHSTVKALKYVQHTKVSYAKLAGGSRWVNLYV